MARALAIVWIVLAIASPAPAQHPLPPRERTLAERVALSDAVESLYPGFRPQVLDAKGAPHRFVRLFLNGDELGEEALATRVGPGDEVEVLAAIAGG